MNYFFLLSSGVLSAVIYRSDGNEALLTLAAVLLFGSAFYNWLFRLLVFAVATFLLPVPATYGTILLFLAVFNVPTFSILGIRAPQPVRGSVFITGCDSGMGFWTASHLADLGQCSHS